MLSNDGDAGQPRGRQLPAVEQASLQESPSSVKLNYRWVKCEVTRSPPTNHSLPRNVPRILPTRRLAPCTLPRPQGGEKRREWRCENDQWRCACGIGNVWGVCLEAAGYPRNCRTRQKAVCKRNLVLQRTVLVSDRRSDSKSITDSVRSWQSDVNMFMGLSKLIIADYRYYNLSVFSHC